jgi:hypothetical protein
MCLQLQRCVAAAAVIFHSISANYYFTLSGNIIHYQWLVISQREIHAVSEPLGMLEIPGKLVNTIWRAQTLKECRTFPQNETCVSRTLHLAITPLPLFPDLFALPGRQLQSVRGRCIPCWLIWKLSSSSIARSQWCFMALSAAISPHPDKDLFLASESSARSMHLHKKGQQQPMGGKYRKPNKRFRVRKNYFKFLFNRQDRQGCHLLFQTTYPGS